MASIHKDKKRNSYYIKHNHTTYRGFKTKYEAEIFKAKLLIDDTEINNSLNNITFIDLSSKYLDYLKTNSSYATYSKYSNIINNILIPNISDLSTKKICDINENDCDYVRNFIINLNYSTSYKNNIISVYKCIFKYAYKYYDLSIDPSRFMEKIKLTYNERLNKRLKEANIWSIEEFNKFINEVSNIQYKLLFTTLYFTGMRLGEALALKWYDIYDCKINIYKNLTRKTDSGIYEIKEPKTTYSERCISINKSLYKSLLEYKEQEKRICGFSEDWFVFGRIDPLPQTSIDRIKDKAISKANVKRIRIHDFRHSHASYLISNGISLPSVSKRLGHSDINITLSIYTHVIKKVDDDMVDFLEENYTKVLTKFSRK